MSDSELAERRWDRLFSHPLRVAILRYLLEHERASPALLASELGEGLQNVGYHVGCLCEAGQLVLVGTTGRRGAHVYRLSHPDAVSEALRCRERAADPRDAARIAASVAARRQLRDALRDVRRRRVMQGVTREAFADRLGITLTRLKRIERAEADPPLTLLIRIARELRTNLGEIFTEVESDCSSR